MKGVQKITTAGAVTIIALVINCGLFSLFPVLHRMFTDAIYSAVSPVKNTEVIMEYKKPEKKEQAPKERRIRQAATRHRGSTAQQVQFRFAPDLAVEGSGDVAMEQQELAAAIVNEGETDEPLVPIYRPNLTFSERARELEIEGILEVLLIVDTEGKVSSIEVVRSPHPTITTEARKVLATWRFKPALNKGIPVRVRIRQVVEFKLD